MKKKLIFVIDSLSLGGAEKSLVTLLNMMDYSRYEVDLLLFAHGGAYQQLLPPEVNLLSVPDYFQYTGIPWQSIFKKLAHPMMMFAQIMYSIGIRVGKHNHPEKAVIFWKTTGKCFKAMPQDYDVAIAYAQGTPTFFVADKVKAKKKLAWINVTYKPQGKYLEYIKPYYSHFDMVNAVSESVVGQIKDTFDLDDRKIMCMHDILDVEFANKMSDIPSSVNDDMDGSGIKLLTVGRLASMKGYDLAIEAASILKTRGLDFTWYSLGEGALRKELESLIKRYNLENEFILLGSRANPYPYFRNCDLYVQTSRFEGFGITLAEAKMFNKPIVTTNFDAVGEQFINEHNGLIVDISAQDIADGIIRMMNDEVLRNKCISSVSVEKKGNAEEIRKLYCVIG